MKNSTIAWLVTAGLGVGSAITGLIAERKIEDIEANDDLTIEEKRAKEGKYMIAPVVLGIACGVSGVTAACLKSNETKLELDAQIREGEIAKAALLASVPDATDWEQEEVMKTTIYKSADPTSDKFLAMTFNEWTGEKTAFVAVPLKDASFDFDGSQYPIGSTLKTESSINLDDYDLTKGDYQFTLV